MAVWTTHDQPRDASEFPQGPPGGTGDLFTQLLGLLETAGAVKLDRVMHDGTKIQAQAGAQTFRREGTLRANLEKARAVVEQMANKEAESSSAGATCGSSRRANGLPENVWSGWKRRWLN